MTGSTAPGLLPPQASHVHLHCCIPNRFPKGHTGEKYKSPSGGVKGKTSWDVLHLSYTWIGAQAQGLGWMSAWSSWRPEPPFRFNGTSSFSFTRSLGVIKFEGDRASVEGER